ncbi:MAG: hypothetical protein LBK82_06095 [Planctomycetaceae bacterium]|nr:hypothetical protein [Planctomycetaceae bacterium]
MPATNKGKLAIADATVQRTVAHLFSSSILLAQAGLTHGRSLFALIL